jgi:hypothetical protein
MTASLISSTELAAPRRGRSQPRPSRIRRPTRTTTRAAAHPCPAVRKPARRSRSAEHPPAITDGSVWRQPDSLGSQRGQILGARFAHTLERRSRYVMIAGCGYRAHSCLNRIAGSIRGWQWRPDLADLRAYGSSGSTPSLVLRRRVMSLAAGRPAPRARRGRRAGRVETCRPGHADRGEAQDVVAEVALMVPESPVPPAGRRRGVRDASAKRAVLGSGGTPAGIARAAGAGAGCQ